MPRRSNLFVVPLAKTVCRQLVVALSYMLLWRRRPTEWQNARVQADGQSYRRLYGVTGDWQDGTRHLTLSVYTARDVPADNHGQTDRYATRRSENRHRCCQFSREYLSKQPRHKTFPRELPLKHLPLRKRNS